MGRDNVMDERKQEEEQNKVDPQGEVTKQLMSAIVQLNQKLEEKDKIIQDLQKQVSSIVEYLKSNNNNGGNMQAIAQALAPVFQKLFEPRQDPLAQLGYQMLIESVKSSMDMNKTITEAIASTVGRKLGSSVGSQVVSGTGGLVIEHE